MNEEVKQFLLFLLVSLLMTGMALAGLVVIRQKTEEKLAELEEEAKRIAMVPDSQKLRRNSLLYLKTEKENLTVGEMVNLQIVIQSKGETVDGVEFILAYNPELISIGEPILGSFFSLYPLKEVDSDKGTVRIIALRAPEEMNSLNEEVLVTLPVSILKKGRAEFRFDQEKSHIVSYAGQEILQEARLLTLNIE